MMLMTFHAVGANVRVEYPSSNGFIDLVLIHGNQLFFLEFKPKHSAQSTEAVLTQPITHFRDREYEKKYKHYLTKIHRIAIVFDEDVGNLLEIQAEEIMTH